MEVAYRKSNKIFLLPTSWRKILKVVAKHDRNHISVFVKAGADPKPNTREEANSVVIAKRHGQDNNVSLLFELGAKVIDPSKVFARKEYSIKKAYVKEKTSSRAAMRKSY